MMHLAHFYFLCFMAVSPVSLSVTHQQDPRVSSDCVSCQVTSGYIIPTFHVSKSHCTTGENQGWIQIYITEATVGK